MSTVSPFLLEKAVVTLTRSSSHDEHGMPGRRLQQHRKRSTSFTLHKDPAAAPKCPGDEAKKRSEWQTLAIGLRAAFFRTGEISPDHPAALCLRKADVPSLRDELFSHGEWRSGCYTRTLLLDGECFNVMLLCWAPGCSSPVHGHSCAETHVDSNCFMLILEGSLAETVYGDDAILADGKSVDARLGKTRMHKAGACAYINDSLGLHKVENPTDGRAVSMHIYAPGWKRPPLFEEVYPEVDAGGAEIEVDGWGD